MDTPESEECSPTPSTPLAPRARPAPAAAAPWWGEAAAARPREVLQHSMASSMVELGVRVEGRGHAGWSSGEVRVRVRASP